MVIAYATGYLPPNLNYSVPREGVAALAEKRLQVVTDKTPWNRGMSGVNSFGFGGANAHVLLKNIARKKVRRLIFFLFLDFLGFAVAASEALLFASTDGN